MWAPCVIRHNRYAAKTDLMLGTATRSPWRTSARRNHAFSSNRPLAARHPPSVFVSHISATGVPSLRKIGLAYPSKENISMPENACIVRL